MRILIFILLCCSVFLIDLEAQEVIEVVQIEKDQGLKDRIVDRVIRDDCGYFILLMYNSMQRYDGRDFTSIETSVFTSNSHKVRDAVSVEKLNNGTIVFIIDDADFLYYLPPRSDRVMAAPVRGFPIVSNGELYLLSPIKSETTSVSYTLHAAVLTNQISSTPIYDVNIGVKMRSLVRVGDMIYLQDFEDNLYVMDDEKIESLDGRGTLVKRNNTAYILGTTAINKLDERSIIKVVDIPSFGGDPKVCKVDARGNLVMAYSNRVRFNDKIFVLDLQEKIHEFHNIPEVSNTFKDFYTDNAFSRWMLVGYNGMHIINLVQKGTEFILKRPNVQKGEFGQVISGVASGVDGSILFSKESAGVFETQDSQDGHRELFENYRNKGWFTENSKMYYDSNSAHYYSYGYRYENKSNVYEMYPQTKEVVRYVVPHKLNDIYKFNNNNYLLGGYYEDTEVGVLSIFNTVSQEIETIREAVPQIRSIYHDVVDDRFWIGTYAGVEIYDSNWKLITKLDKSSEGKKRLQMDHIIDVFRFGDHMLLGSFGGGVYVVDPKGLEITGQLSVDNGLTDNNVMAIIGDNLGNCWVTTFNGANVIDQNLRIVKKIYEHDGLPNREFNAKAIAKDSKGVLYAGTLNGLAILDPKKILEWKDTYKFAIESITGYSGKQTESLPVSNLIQLTTDFDSIFIKFNLPDYHSYPYINQLVDVTSNGVQFKNENNTIKVYDLKYSENDLRITASNSNEDSIIKIIKRSNQAKYLYILLSILIVSLLAYFVSKYIIKRSRKQIEEKAMLHRKISDLQLTSLQSQMNPHFIFNALGAVQYFIQTQDTERADDYLSNFAMLMRSILESSKSKYIRLGDELKLLELYIGLESVRFEDKFDYEINVDTHVDFEIEIPPMIMQPFIENAINHGLMNLENRRGLLQINVSQPNDDTVIVRIADNGIGREKAARLRSKTHKPRGMQIVQERLETINNIGEINVKTTTEDLKSRIESLGTKITITIDTRDELQ